MSITPPILKQTRALSEISKKDRSVFEGSGLEEFDTTVSK